MSSTAWAWRTAADVPDRIDADGEVHTERSDLLWAAWESLSEKDQDWLGYDGLAELIEWRADRRKLRWIYAHGEPLWPLCQRGGTDNPKSWGSTRFEMYHRLNSIQHTRAVADAITHYTRATTESWEAWRERMGQPARDFIETLLIRATDHPDTLQPHEFRMVERFTKQVMEYDLGTPTRRVEISDGRGLPTLGDFNKLAREFAGELVGQLQAANAGRPRLPAIDIPVDVSEPGAGEVGEPGHAPLYSEHAPVGTDSLPEAFRSGSGGRTQRKKPRKRPNAVREDAAKT
jgi:hypothetical protein